MSAKVAMWEVAVATTESQSKEQAFQVLVSFFEHNPTTKSILFEHLQHDKSLRQAVETLFGKRDASGKVQSITSEADLRSLSSVAQTNRSLNVMQVDAFTGNPTQEPAPLIWDETVKRLNQPQYASVRNTLIIGATSPGAALAARADEVAAAAVPTRVEPAAPSYVTHWKQQFDELTKSKEYSEYYRVSGVNYSKVEDPVRLAQEGLARSKPIQEDQLKIYYSTALQQILFGVLDARYMREYSVSGPVQYGIGADAVYNSLDMINALNTKPSMDTLRTELAKVSTVGLAPGDGLLVKSLILRAELVSEGYAVSDIAVPGTTNRKEVAAFDKALRKVRNERAAVLAHEEQEARAAVTVVARSLHTRLVSLGLTPSIGTKQKDLADILEKGFARMSDSPQEFTLIFERIQAARESYGTAKREIGDKPQTLAYEKLSKDLKSIQADLEATAVITYQERAATTLGTLADRVKTLEDASTRAILERDHTVLIADVQKLTQPNTTADIPRLEANIRKLGAAVDDAIKRQEEARAAAALAAAPVETPVDAARNSAETAIRDLEMTYRSLNDQQQKSLAFFASTINLLKLQFKQNDEGGDNSAIYADITQRATGTLTRLKKATAVAGASVTLEQEVISNPNNAPGISVTFSSADLATALRGKKLVYSIVIEDSRGDVYLPAMSGPRQIEYAAVITREEGSFVIKMRRDASGGVVDAKSGTGELESIGIAKKTGNRWSLSFREDLDSRLLDFVQGTKSAESILSALHAQDDKSSVTVTGTAARQTTVRGGDRVFANAQLVEK